nr:MAG TPA: cell division protein [Caudoviricetes sp.]
MINYKDESTMNKRIMLPVIIGILLFCIGTVAIIKYPTEDKTVKDFEARLKILEEKNSDLIKKLDYEKRISELEKKTK